MAKERIKEGKNHQETFDAVYAEIKEQPETIAKILRYVPTLEKRYMRFWETRVNDKKN